MHIDRLTTKTFTITPGGYTAVWVRWILARHAPSIAAFAAGCIVMGCLDIRYAISICMLAAVILPFAGLLIWNKAMRTAYSSGALQSQSVEVSDGNVTVTFNEGDSRAHLKAGLRGARTTAGHIVLRLNGHDAPLIIPASSIISFKEIPETF